MAVTPVPIKQIEKFHCLKLSTTQGLSTGTVARVTWKQSLKVQICGIYVFFISPASGEIH